ncbi:unnamed protein product [Rotaria magnacalcarata]|uniref:BK channel n=1 Tax=Rotaria magnacalcarata TaxID=392030 RepID=A0A8S2L4L9_9BILA|nr:unnamed protein product [Rotaria magnacalcarata]CAF3882543.1 unnamed protein product [Rotaria magnacalcarata]
MTICPACSPEHSNKSLDPLCNGERIWTTFLFTSFGILLGGWIIIFIYEVLSELCVKLQNIRSHGTKENTHLKQMNLPHGDDAADYDCNWLQEIKSWDNNIISGQTKMGKTFFAVAKSKRRFWFSLYSIVDIFTISPSFLAFYLNRTWIGFRFLRALPLMSIPNILQYMGVIERPRKIRIAQLASKFIALLLTASGFVHLVENSGDFFCDYCNAQELDAFNAVYFMIITMTTVGYGDFSCKTYIGKSFVILSLMGGLTIFATMIPEFSNLFGSKGPYFDRYHRVKGRRHVIICGHTTPHSLAAFLRDFLHKGREKMEKLDVLIIDRKVPDIEMEAILKRYYAKLQYFVGSIMNIADLQRVQADKATACLIIANKECQDASSDDSANIMRVISLKNFNQRIRIILQLLQYHNKLNVASIPGWNMESDEVICIAELKLGLIGMSCIVTGFATMMTNIFRMSSYNIQKIHDMPSICFGNEDNPDESTQAWSWRDLYHRGAGMKLYLEELPPSFYGKSFAESALVCFKLGVMLLAIEKERKDEHGNTRIAVDVVPCDDCIIIRGSRAFIVCMSSEDANRVKYYCSICYPIIDNLTELQLARMRVCFHARSTDWVQNEEMPIIDQPGDSEESEHAIVTIHDADVTRPLMTQQSERICTPCYQRSNTFLDEDMSSFDSTGMFYFTPSRNIQDAVLDVNSLREYHNIRHRSKTVQDGGVQCKHPLQFRDPIDSNVQYVEQGHTDEADLPFFLTTPFASGTAFADSVLDCILSCAYYNENAVNLLRNILMGGIDPQLEEILAEGKRFEQCQTPKMLKNRRRARVIILAIQDLIPNIDTRTEPVTFSSLFIESLGRHRMVVMGIYRRLDVLFQKDPSPKSDRPVDYNKRIVIYYPPYNYEIDPSDLVYAMQHSHLKGD